MHLSDLDDFHELHGVAAAAARKAGAGDESADIASDLLTAAWDSDRQFADVEHAKAWLQKAARNRAIDQHRHERVVEANYERDNQVTFTSALVAREKLRVLVERLPEKYHEVIWLTYEQGFGAREIGERLDYTEATVHKMLSEARAMLRPQITDPRVGPSPLD